MSCLSAPYIICIVAVFFAGSFLIGSIPFGYLIGRLAGVDVRAHGSGNIGATNVGRVLGKKLGALVLALDFLKSFAPLYALRQWWHWHGNMAVPSGLWLAAFLMVLGHNFTPWLKFRGGKGVATSAGALAALVPWVFSIVILTWVVTLAFSRYVSIASIAASAMVPLAMLVFHWEHPSYVAFGLALGMLTIWRHRSNLQRLRAGTEPRWGQPRQAAAI